MIYRNDVNTGIFYGLKREGDECLKKAYQNVKNPRWESSGFYHDG